LYVAESVPFLPITLVRNAVTVFGTRLAAHPYLFHHRMLRITLL
jgi:hypothetical protein